MRDALSLDFFEEWDVIFSNAVFHWIQNQREFLRQVSRALKPGGLLVCELEAPV